MIECMQAVAYVNELSWYYKYSKPTLLTRCHMYEL